MSDCELNLCLRESHALTRCCREASASRALSLHLSACSELPFTARFCCARVPAHVLLPMGTTALWVPHQLSLSTGITGTTYSAHTLTHAILQGAPVGTTHLSGDRTRRYSACRFHETNVAYQHIIPVR